MENLQASEFDPASFNQFIIENEVIGFFKEPIKLKSGRISNWYVNWRSVAEDVFLIDRLSDFVLAFTDDLKNSGAISELPDCFYGVPEGATKLGVLTQYKWAKKQKSYAKGSHVLPMGRAKPKEHGVARDRFYVGCPKGKVIVLEDVTTTGGSLIETIKSLQLSDVEILATFGLTNRMEKRDDGLSVAEAIQRMQSKGRPIPYFQLSKATELLPLAFEARNPGAVIGKAIEKEFLEYGVENLKLPL